MNSVDVKLFGSKSNVKVYVGMVLCIPSYGPCTISSIDEKEIFGRKVIVCSFDNKEQHIKLNVPVERFEKVGIRQITNTSDIEKILKSVFKKHSSISKCVWTKRVQEYELKFSSGNLLRIAEIVKDLYVGIKRFDKSYSEKSLFNKAFDFLVAEYAVSYGITIEEANRRITDIFDDNLCKDNGKNNIKELDSIVDDFDDDDENEDNDEEDDEKVA